MIRTVPGLLAFIITFTACLSASEIKGKIIDPSGAPVSGAQIAVVNRVGVVAQTTAAPNGSFQLDAPESQDTRLVVAAPGFSTRTVALDQAASVQLEIAPLNDSVQVVGSTIEIPSTLQASSVNLIPVSRVRSSNEPFALDLLRYVPGVAFNQTGAPGGRHQPVPARRQLQYEPGSDRWCPGEFVRRQASILLTSRPRPWTISISFAARNRLFTAPTPMPAPSTSSPAAAGARRSSPYWPKAAATTSAASPSPAAEPSPASVCWYPRRATIPMAWCANNDYRNEDVLLNLTRRFGRQSLSVHGYFDSSEVGEPGPWGSNPQHIFTGIDTVSRAKNNFSEYGAHYEADLSPRVRQELFGSFFLYNSGFQSQYGFSFNKDLRGQGEARTIVSVSRHDTASFGVTGGREEVKNSFITDAGFSTFPIERNEIAVYAENRYEVADRLFLSAGVRAEFFRTPSIPGDGFSRPLFPGEQHLARESQALGGLCGRQGTRLHASFGMGLRPPSGFELAFTNNPALKPERTRSIDAGVEQKFGNLLTLDATYFYNRYYDLIVTLGGSLTTLSHYKSANLANSQAQGAEFSARLRPARWVFVTGSYTLLETRILSLDGSSNQAPLPFAVGQQLTRRPEHSGNVVATFTRGRFAADLTGYFRGRVLSEEPNFGASSGLFWNSGFANVGVNLNYALGRGRHGLRATCAMR